MVSVAFQATAALNITIPAFMLSVHPYRDACLQEEFTIRFWYSVVYGLNKATAGTSHRFSIHNYATFCSAGDVMQGFIHLLNQGPAPDVVHGDTCTGPAGFLATIGKVYKFAQVSSIASGALLNDVDAYPYFARAILDGNAVIVALRLLLSANGWNVVNIAYNRLDPGSETVVQLARNIIGQDVDFPTSIPVDQPVTETLDPELYEEFRMKFSSVTSPTAESRIVLWLPPVNKFIQFEMLLYGGLTAPRFQIVMGSGLFNTYDLMQNVSAIFPLFGVFPGEIAADKLQAYTDDLFANFDDWWVTRDSEDFWLNPSLASTFSRKFVNHTNMVHVAQTECGSHQDNLISGAAQSSTALGSDSGEVLGRTLVHMIDNGLDITDGPTIFENMVNLPVFDGFSGPFKLYDDGNRIGSYTCVRYDGNETPVGVISTQVDWFFAPTFANGETSMPSVFPPETPFPISVAVATSTTVDIEVRLRGLDSSGLSRGLRLTAVNIMVDSQIIKTFLTNQSSNIVRIEGLQQDVEYAITTNAETAAGVSDPSPITLVSLDPKKDCQEIGCIGQYAECKSGATTCSCIADYATEVGEIAYSRECRVRYTPCSKYTCLGDYGTCDEEKTGICKCNDRNLAALVSMQKEDDKSDVNTMLLLESVYLQTGEVPNDFKQCTLNIASTDETRRFWSISLWLSAWGLLGSIWVVWEFFFNSQLKHPNSMIIILSYLLLSQTFA